MWKETTMSVGIEEECSIPEVCEVDFKYNSILKIPMKDAESSLIAKQVLSVDEELQPLKLKKTITNEENLLIL